MSAQKKDIKIRVGIIGCGGMPMANTCQACQGRTSRDGSFCDIIKERLKKQLKNTEHRMQRSIPIIRSYLRTTA